MKNVFFFLLLALYQNILSAEISSNTQKILTAGSFTINEECGGYEKIEGNDYCVKRSIITLKSCGRQSDWPCMEENGCLIINKFTMQD